MVQFHHFKSYNSKMGPKTELDNQTKKSLILKSTLHSIFISNIYFRNHAIQNCNLSFTNQNTALTAVKFRLLKFGYCIFG